VEWCTILIGAAKPNPNPNPIHNPNPIPNPTNPNPSPTFKMAALRNGGLTPVDRTVRTDRTAGSI